jgi:hypothetical protein
MVGIREGVLKKAIEEAEEEISQRPMWMRRRRWSSTKDAGSAEEKITSDTGENEQTERNR